MGLMGWVREHLGLKLLLARHVSQCNPASQLSFRIHVLPSYDPKPNKSRKKLKDSVFFSLQNPLIKLRSLHDPFLSSWWLALWRKDSLFLLSEQRTDRKVSVVDLMRFAYLESRGNLKNERRLNQENNEKGDQSLQHCFLPPKEMKTLNERRRRKVATSSPLLCVKILMNSKKQINKRSENKKEE